MHEYEGRLVGHLKVSIFVILNRNILVTCQSFKHLLTVFLEPAALVARQTRVALAAVPTGATVNFIGVIFPP